MHASAADKDKTTDKSFKKSIGDLREAYEDVPLDKVKYEHVSSGNLMVDWAIGEGLPRGSIFDLFGVESLGKTTMILSLMGERTKFGEKCVFIDVEHRINPKLVDIVVPNKENLEIFRPKDGNSTFALIEKLVLDHPEVRMIGVDSIAAIVPNEMFEEDFNPNRTGILANRTQLTLRKIMKAVQTNGTIVFLVNQMRANLQSWRGGLTPTGGNAIKFLASVRMYMQPDSPIMDGETKIGHKVKVTMQKNSWGYPGRTAPLTIIYGKGIDKVRDLIDCGVLTGVITKSVGWYTYEETNKKGEKNMIRAHGEKELIEKLTPIMPKVYEQIREAMVKLNSVGSEPNNETAKE